MKRNTVENTFKNVQKTSDRFLFSLYVNVKKITYYNHRKNTVIVFNMEYLTLNSLYWLICIFVNI